MMSNEEVQEKFAKFRETLHKAIEKAKAAKEAEEAKTKETTSEEPNKE